MITQKRLKELLSYDPDTGLFTNRNTRGPKAMAGCIAGSVDSHGYWQIHTYGKVYRAHRLAWLYVYGEFPAHEIDHINGARLDNRLNNLRSVTRAENSRNQGIRSANTSGVCGVSWYKDAKKWRADIGHKGNQIHLGSFSDKFEAICARKSAENRLGYHKNHGLTSVQRAYPRKTQKTQSKEG